MCHLVNMHRSGQWNITIGSTEKNKSLTSSLLQKISSWKGHQRFKFYKKIRFFFITEKALKVVFIFIKRPTRNSVNDLDDEIGVLIKKTRAFNTENGSQILFLTNSR